MFAKGTKAQKINFLTEFYREKYRRRDFKFRASEINLSLNKRDFEKLLLEITLCTDFRIMKFHDSEGDYFIICKA